MDVVDLTANGEDIVDASLRSLIETLEEVGTMCADVAAQAAHVRQLRAAGQSYRAIAADQQQTLEERVTQMTGRLIDAGSVVRRVHARALHDEGATMEQIAALFGVTRQRVSALLRAPAEAPGEE